MQPEAPRARRAGSRAGLAINLSQVWAFLVLKNTVKGLAGMINPKNVLLVGFAQ